MNRFHSVWVIVLVAVILTGCQTQSLFVPTPHHVHLFKDKGEVQLSGSVNSAGVSGNIAFSPVEKIEFFGSYHRNNYSKGLEFQHQQFAEVGFGFYDKDDDPFITELLFGIGKGKSSFFDTEMTFKDRLFQESEVDANFTRVFAQFNGGLTSHILDFGLSLRASQIRFPDYSFETFPIRAEFNRYMFLAEPMVFANVGYRNIRVEGMLGYPLLVGDQTSSKLDGLTFSAGIKIMLNRKFEWSDY